MFIVLAVLIGLIFSAMPLTMKQTEQVSKFPEDLVEVDDTAMFTQSMDSTYGTRGTRATEIEPNNLPVHATKIPITTGTNLIGDISSGTDIDWFKMELDVQADTNGKYIEQVDNMILRHTDPLSGDNGYYLGVFVYGVFDINQNGVIDFDTEMILMNFTRFRIGSSSANSVIINSFNNKYYYIKLETDGGQATYRLQLNKNSQAPNDDAYDDIKYASSVAPPISPRVRMGLDAFDWFEIKRAHMSDAVGLNFSLKVTMDKTMSMQSFTLPNGTMIYPVTVLHMLIYHEGAMLGNEPTFPYQYRDHLMLSRHSSLDLDDEVEYSDIIALPSNLFRWTFIGFYIESYGVDPTRPGVKFYPIVDEMITYIGGSYCEFTIETLDTKSIKRPLLEKVSIISTTTNKIRGRTYDNYQYTVIYRQENNYKPFMTQISIYTLDGEIRENMVKVTPGTVGDMIYEEGCKYKIIVSGRLLGEGDHHVFQFHFKDKNAWANGTIELGKSWHGPYVSNNLEPFVRPTAPTELVLYEDDNTTFFEMNSIFEDVDLNENLDFTIADPNGALEDGNIVWGKNFNNSILEVNIVNQTRLRIDLKPDKNGEVPILLNVSDKSHNYLDSPFVFTIRVLPVNDPPQIIKYFDYLIIKEDDVNTEINLFEYFIDPIDKDLLTFRVENNNHLDVTINQESVEDEQYGVVTIAPRPNWFGTEYIDFYASDGISEVTDYLKIIVKPVNDPPQLSVNKTIELMEDRWFNFTINASDAADGEKIIITQNMTEIFSILEEAPNKFGYTFDNVSGYLTFKPTNDMVGEYVWNISAVDVHGDQNYTHVTLIIININDPPIPKILSPELGSRYLTTDYISFRGTAADPDSVLKDVDFIWYLSTFGARRKIGSGRTLPSQLYENGSHTIILSVRDEQFVSNTSIVIHIFSINQEQDSDDDGIPDYWENLHNFNIHDPHDADDDTDMDTYSNWEEYKVNTDPRDPLSAPEKHITKKTKDVEDGLPAAVVVFILLIIVMSIMVLYIFIDARRKRMRKHAGDHEPGSTKGIIGMSSGQGRGFRGPYKPPKVVCPTCGKSMEVMTLNRPVVVTCTDCGKRGAVY